MEAPDVAAGATGSGLRSPAATGYRSTRRRLAGDKIYCVHEADDAETVLEHARRGGFPANRVTEVAGEFGAHTAESAATR